MPTNSSITDTDTSADASSNRLGKRSVSSLRDFLAPIVAIGILVLFAVFIDYLLGLGKAQEVEWTRALYLFNGAEAIAFAAAGFFFGSEIHRQRAEKAEGRVVEAEKRATNAEKDATKETTKGKVLAETINSKLAARSSVVDYGELGENVTETLMLTDLKELAELSNRLFP